MSANHDHETQLRAMGYRLTPQRQIILNALRRTGGHLTVLELYDIINAENPAIDRATVYRTMELFHEIGFVFSSQISGSTVYELASEIPHHHLVCRKCGQVQVLDDHHFADLVNHLYKDHAFQAELAHMTIPGVCKHCQ